MGITSLKVANPTFSFWRAVLGNIVRCASCQWAGWKLARTVNSLLSYLPIKKTQMRGQRALPPLCALRISVAGSDLGRSPACALSLHQYVRFIFYGWETLEYCDTGNSLNSGHSSMPSFSNSFQIRFPHTWPSTCDFNSLFLCKKHCIVWGSSC